jgi:meso-butanediol dehydrogenase / (S,S)-butanediol dehydrogenase / diacetyl reductase
MTLAMAESIPRRALVTGGSSGLGYAVAAALLDTGAQVAIADVDEASLRKAEAEMKNLRLLPIRVDVTSRESVRAAVERCRLEFGGLDTLVNSAGIFSFVKLEDIREEEWDRVIDVNLKGVFLCCQAAAPLLRASGRGRIVTIASDAGQKAYPMISNYCASKFGVIGFSQAIAGELAADGVTVNCVCPIGITSTGMGQQVLDILVAATGRPAESILVSREQSVPLKRMARVEDVVNAVMFFISDRSSFLTAETLNVDGGVLGTGVVPGIAD